MKQLNPKCITENRDLAYTTSGHLTPCCWVNTSFNEPYLEEILSDKMHIDNFETIEDILTSKPWTKFFSMLKDYPDNAPFTCKRYCSSGKSWEEIEGNELRIASDD